MAGIRPFSAEYHNGDQPGTLDLWAYEKIVVVNIYTLQY